MAVVRGDFRLVPVELMSDLQLYVHSCRPQCEPDTARHAIPHWL
jgi:hypothetical protein